MEESMFIYIAAVAVPFRRAVGLVVTPRLIFERKEGYAFANSGFEAAGRRRPES